MRSVTVPKIARTPLAIGDVMFGDEVRIPAWIVDLGSFRRWAKSEAFPRSGWFSYLAGEIWVDMNMEQLFSHNAVKTEFTIVVGGLVRTENLGRYFSDRVLLSNVAADLSTEPDGSFVSYDALRSGQVRLVEGATGGHVELEGSPDMVLEIISRSSVHKDTEVLRELYSRAGISEYWLVDARGETPSFEIFRSGAKGYVPVRRQAGGWIKSPVFGRSFRLSRQADPLGNPLYNLAVQK